MNVQQEDLPEALIAETMHSLEEATARIFHALRQSARQQQARQAGSMEYDSWCAAMEYDSWCGRFC